MPTHCTKGFCEAIGGRREVDGKGSEWLFIARMLVKGNLAAQACGACPRTKVGKGDRMVTRKAGRAFEQPEYDLPCGGHPWRVQSLCIERREPAEAILLNRPARCRLWLQSIVSRIEPIGRVPRRKRGFCGEALLL